MTFTQSREVVPLVPSRYRNSDSLHSMSINSSSPNLLLQIYLCNTPEPTVNRMLSVPSQMTFTELHETIAVAFAWTTEPCTSWVFKTVIPDPTHAPQETKFTAFWTAPDQGYNMVPTHHGTHLAIGLCMEKARVGRYWTYDYNMSKERHAIKVIDTLTAADLAPKVACVGGFGHIDRKLWQLASLIGHGSQVRAEHCVGVMDLAAVNVRLGEIQARFEERTRVEAIVPAVPKDDAKKRTAPLESGSANPQAGNAKKDWVAGKFVNKVRVTNAGSKVQNRDLE